MEQLDLNQILTFVRIAQAGSLTKAAEKLRQPKSRLSRKLAALEKDLGTALFFRTTRQIQLTAAGKIYFEKCQALIEGLVGLSAQMNDSSQEMTGLIRVTASDDMGSRFLPDVIKEYTELFPNVKIEVILSQAYVDLVKESIDVAIRVGPLRDSNLKVRKLGLVKNVFVASPQYFERRGRLEEIDQLENHDFLKLIPSQGQSRPIEVYKVSSMQKVKVQLKSQLAANNPEILVRLAMQGRGVTYLPEFLVRDAIKSGELVVALKNYHGPLMPINLVMPEQADVPIRLKKFNDLVIQKMRQVLAQN